MDRWQFFLSMVKMKGRPGSSQEQAKILDITNNSSTDEWSSAMLQHCSCCLSSWRYNVPHYAYRFRNKKLGGGYVGRDLSCILFCMPYIIKTSLKTCAVSEGLRSTLSVPNLHGPDLSTYVDIALIFEAPPPNMCRASLFHPY